MNEDSRLLNELAVRAKEGREAVAELMERISPLLDRLSRKKVYGYDPEELRSEFVLRVLESLGKYSPGRGTFISWVRMVCKSHAKDLKRNGRRQKRGKNCIHIDLDELEQLWTAGNGGNGDRQTSVVDPVVDPREIIIARLDFEALVADIKAHVTRKLHVLVDLAAEGLTVTDLAKELGLPRSTVQRRIERIRKASKPIIDRTKE